MKILSLGLEQLVLDKDSSVAQRIASYGLLVDEYTIIVPHSKNKSVDLSNKVRAFGVGGNAKFLQLFNIYKFASNFLRNNKYDLITVQDQYYLALLSWLLAKKYRLALEIQVHGIEKYGGLRKIIAHHVLPKADIIRTVSNRLKNRLQDVFNVDKSKIIVVPIYTGEIQATNNKDYKLKNPAILLTISRLVPIKNIELQLRALAVLKKENFYTELWIVGDGPEEKKLKELSQNLKVEKYVKFWGWHEKLENFYQQADCFLLTSNFEGWGMVIIEAAHHGLPIIMTDVGCAGEVIKNKESGIVIPIGDLGKLVEALREVLVSDNLRSSLGMNAQAATQTLPTKEQTLDLYRNSWEKAIANVKLSNNKK
ncbi:MAG TPA: glycosyltransferase family 4 protein [bacterium]|mgnify:CR=1 FL=1|nr:glycosyltransferase family 4 protein [bacterium]